MTKKIVEGAWKRERNERNGRKRKVSKKIIKGDIMEGKK